MKLSEKLETLGAAGRARLGRAWADPELTIVAVEQRFGFTTMDTDRLKELLGAKAKPAPGSPNNGNLRMPAGQRRRSA